MKHFCEIAVVLTVLIFLPVNCDPIFKPLFKFGKLLLKKELKGGGFGGPLGGGGAGGGGGGGNIFIGIGIQCNGQGGCNGLTAGRDFQFPNNGQRGITTQITQPTRVPTTTFAGQFPTTSLQFTPSPSNVGRFQQQQLFTSTITGSNSNFCGNGCFFDKVIGGCNCKFRSVLSFS